VLCLPRDIFEVHVHVHALLGMGGAAHVKRLLKLSCCGPLRVTHVLESRTLIMPIDFSFFFMQFTFDGLIACLNKYVDTLIGFNISGVESLYQTIIFNAETATPTYFYEERLSMYYYILSYSKGRN
jgi:hypothetical protein